MTLTFDMPDSYKEGIATITVVRKDGNGLLAFIGGADLSKSDHWTIDNYGQLAPVIVEAQDAR